ncbi:Palmitoyltransferase ZDHHC17 [Papilio machaon]|uniref:Palmitoyltransferase ZDHHC17 n=1 Tax=Papilio machaon TaxID=76193 RepID=A0A194RFN0_PAPMA|nr:Palmitoyltransferase ZDHHC17 [Papilio machaon]
MGHGSKKVGKHCSRPFISINGNASLDVPNLRGATPAAMLQAGDCLWLGSKVADRVREHALLTTRRSIFRRLTYEKKFRWWCVVAMPFMAFYVTGLVLEIDTLYMFKMFLLVCFYAVLHFLGNALFDDELKNIFPLSVYLATKVRESAECRASGHCAGLVLHNVGCGDHLDHVISQNHSSA